MNTPLLSIRIKHSEAPSFTAGQSFDTVAEFDATMRAVRANAAGGRVAFVVTWKDRATFHGLYDLELNETLVEHVARVGRLALAEPRLQVLLPGIRITLMRLFRAVLAERLDTASPSRERKEGSCHNAAA